MTEPLISSPFISGCNRNRSRGQPSTQPHGRRTDASDATLADGRQLSSSSAAAILMQSLTLRSARAPNFHACSLVERPGSVAARSCIERWVWTRAGPSICNTARRPCVTFGCQKRRGWRQLIHCAIPISSSRLDQKLHGRGNQQLGSDTYRTS